MTVPDTTSHAMWGAAGAMHVGRRPQPGPGWQWLRTALELLVLVLLVEAPAVGEMPLSGTQ